MLEVDRLHCIEKLKALEAYHKEMLDAWAEISETNQIAKEARKLMTFAKQIREVLEAE